MRRPPRESAAASRSMAWAICGSARWTAGATLASSALMMLAISTEDLRSRSVERELDFSVVRCWRSEALRFKRLSPQLLAAGEKQVLRCAQDDRLYFGQGKQVLPPRQARGQDEGS